MTERKSFVRQAVEKNQHEVEAELAMAREAMLSSMLQAAAKTKEEVAAVEEILLSTGQSIRQGMHRTREASDAHAHAASAALTSLEKRIVDMQDASRWRHVESVMTSTVAKWAAPHWFLTALVAFVVGAGGVWLGTIRALSWVEAEVAQANMAFDGVILKETVFRRDKQGRLMVRFRRDIEQPLIEKGWIYVESPKGKKGRR